MSDQLTFGQTAIPETEPPAKVLPGPVTNYPGPASKKYHAETLLAYLTNIERLSLRVNTIEDWQLISVELLDNCRAALTLVKCI